MKLEGDFAASAWRTQRVSLFKLGGKCSFGLGELDLECSDMAPVANLTRCWLSSEILDLEILSDRSDLWFCLKNWQTIGFGDVLEDNWVCPIVSMLKISFHIRNR